MLFFSGDIIDVDVSLKVGENVVNNTFITPSRLLDHQANNQNKEDHVHGGLTIKMDDLSFETEITADPVPIIQVIRNVSACSEIRYPNSSKERNRLQRDCIFHNITSLKDTSILLEESFDLDVDSFLKKAGPFAEWIKENVEKSENTTLPYR